MQNLKKKNTIEHICQSDGIVPSVFWDPALISLMDVKVVLEHLYLSNGQQNQGADCTLQEETTANLLHHHKVSRTTKERVSSFKYLGITVTSLGTWPGLHTHQLWSIKLDDSRTINSRDSSAILKTSYTRAIESTLTHGNCSNQDYKALQRVVHMAEYI